MITQPLVLSEKFKWSLEAALHPEHGYYNHCCRKYVNSGTTEVLCYTDDTFSVKRFIIHIIGNLILPERNRKIDRASDDVTPSKAHTAHI